MGKITKEDLIAVVAERNATTKTVARSAVDLTIKTIKELVHEGNEVNIVGFAKFYESMTPKRRCRNPHTGEEMESKPRKVSKVKISPNF